MVVRVLLADLKNLGAFHFAFGALSWNALGFCRNG